jgi:excisionase family DNA binding protein
MGPSKIRPRVYTVAEIAQLFSISQRVVRDLIHKGELPALRIGRAYRIPRKAAAAYLARALPSTSRSVSKSALVLKTTKLAFCFPWERYSRPLRKEFFFPII